jgi:hypothetical protein
MDGCQKTPFTHITFVVSLGSDYLGRLCCVRDLACILADARIAPPSSSTIG